MQLTCKVVAITVQLKIICKNDTLVWLIEGEWAQELVLHEHDGQGHMVTQIKVQVFFCKILYNIVGKVQYVQRSLI